MTKEQYIKNHILKDKVLLAQIKRQRIQAKKRTTEEKEVFSSDYELEFGKSSPWKRKGMVRVKMVLDFESKFLAVLNTGVIMFKIPLKYE